MLRSISIWCTRRTCSSIRRVVDDVDKHTQADSYDVWLGNGVSLSGKPADFQVYVGEFQ
jgi:hypothetical protein